MGVKKNSALICLAAGRSQIPLLKAAHSMGFNIIAIDRESDAPGFIFATERIICSTYNSDEVIRNLEEFSDLYDFHGLLARASGPALKTAAYISKKYQITGFTSEFSHLATEKSKIREFCIQNQLPFPKGKKCQVSGKTENDLPFPVLVKPDLPLIGKKNISIVDKDSELPAAIQTACEVSGNGMAEIEKYISGFDTSVMFHAYSGNSRIITFWDELVGLTKDGGIIGLGVSLPSIVEGSIIEERIRKIVSSFCKLNPLVDALLILSFRVDMTGDPYIIELHADLGGDLIADILFPVAMSGFDFFRLVVQIALNQDFSLPQTRVTPTVLLYHSDQYLPKNIQNQRVIDNNLLIQEGNIPENFEYLDRLLDSLAINLKQKPLHIEWLKKWTNWRLIE